MRNTFIRDLVNYARKYDNIVLIVGDLGFSVVEPFAEQYPDRFINVGLAEQNMVSIAAGMASEGYHLFIPLPIFLLFVVLNRYEMILTTII